MPKTNHFGRALVLKDAELEELFDQLKQPHRLLFEICYHTAARVGETIALQRSDLVAGYVVFRAQNTKSKKTRQAIITPPLQKILLTTPLPESGYLFASRRGGHLTTQAADLALRIACKSIGLQGVSTHSFRRTLLTKLHRAGHSLRTIQEVTGHRHLRDLITYLDVGQEEADKALCSLWR